MKAPTNAGMKGTQSWQYDREKRKHESEQESQEEEPPVLVSFDSLGTRIDRIERVLGCSAVDVGLQRQLVSYGTAIVSLLIDQKHNFSTVLFS